MLVAGLSAAGALCHPDGGVAAPAPSAAAGAASLKDCSECPELTEIGGSSKFGFRYATTYEVTWRDYLPAVREQGCRAPITQPERSAPGSDGKLRASVDDPRFATRQALSGISPSDARCYVSWLSKKTGQSYAIPTPRQWRWLAYGTATTIYPWGNDLPFNRALLAKNYDWTAFGKPAGVSASVMPRVVGQTPPDRNGLYDTIGNADELTSSCELWAPPRPVPKRADHPIWSCRMMGGSSLGRGSDDGPPEASVLMSDPYPDAWVGLRLVRR
jgi:formylglycine-generating enzyme required for sulfatase activity